MTEFSWLDGIDIIVVSIGLYFLFTWIRKTGAHFLGVGLLSVAAIYLVALTADLRLTAYLFQVFFTVISVVLVILFQKELRHFLERFALVLFKSPFLRRPLAAGHDEVLDIFVSTIMELARQRVGALIVFQGKVRLESHTHGGSLLQGMVSEPILKSIFDPHSIGHDGALVVVGDRLERFGCHLRLSKNAAEGLKRRGTRHAAALGITEDTDALCIVVSEEQGSVSVAYGRELKPIEDTAALIAQLSSFYDLHYNRPKSVVRKNHIPNFGVVFVSILTAFFMWFFFIHDSAIEYNSFAVPIKYTGLDQTLRVGSMEPAEVRVIVSAPRRYFYFNHASDFSLTVRLYDAEQAGILEQTLVASDVSLPSHMQFENIWPRVVRFNLAKAHTHKAKH
jgi:diadenylate cyclase